MPCQAGDPFGDAVVQTWKANQRNPSAADEIDMMIGTDPPPLSESTFSIRLWAEVDAARGSSTQRIEISHGELQAIRAILALRPR